MRARVGQLPGGGGVEKGHVLSRAGTRTDAQHRHVEQERADGGEDVLAHLPLHLLRVQLGPEALQAEHRLGSPPVSNSGRRKRCARRGEKNKAVASLREGRASPSCRRS